MMFQTRLHITTQQPTPGYIHIGPNEISNLDFYVDNGECSEIVIDLLSYVPLSQLESFFQNIVSKIEPNGKLVIVGMEPISIFKGFLTHRLNLADTNNLLFGQPPLTKVSAVSKDVVESLMNQNGFKVEEVRYNNWEYIVIGRKS